MKRRLKSGAKNVLFSSCVTWRDLICELLRGYGVHAGI